MDNQPGATRLRPLVQIIGPLKKNDRKTCETEKLHIYSQPKGFILNMRRDPFQAIADPTRREILNLISQETLNINSVAGNFDMSRTAIYKHIKILTECGLVVIQQQGRERFCKARLDKLNEVSEWLEQYRKFWTARLDSLEEYLNTIQQKKIKYGKKTGTGNRNR
jgi:DNA-binding transcriptional ArsR family regulator